MNRASLRPKKLYQLAKEFCGVQPSPKRNPKGGRPKTYDDALILTIATVQKLGDFSLRQTLKYSGKYFRHMPSVGSYHARLADLPRGLLKKFIEHLGT